MSIPAHHTRPAACVFLYVSRCPTRQQQGAHPQPCWAEQAGGSEGSHRPPWGLRPLSLGSTRAVPFREGILSTRHAGTAPHSPALP